MSFFERNRKALIQRGIDPARLPPGQYSTERYPVLHVGDVPKMEQIMRRALALDESFDEGAIHEFFIIYEAGRRADQGGGPKTAKEHLDRALHRALHIPRTEHGFDPHP